MRYCSQAVTSQLLVVEETVLAGKNTALPHPDSSLVGYEIIAGCPAVVPTRKAGTAARPLPGFRNWEHKIGNW